MPGQIVRPFVGRRIVPLATLSRGIGRVYDAGRGKVLSTCGDVESNPGPGRMPARSSGGFGHVVDRHMRQLGLVGLFDFEDMGPPEPGPCSNSGEPWVCQSGWTHAYCLCGASLSLRCAETLLQHAEVCSVA